MKKIRKVVIPAAGPRKSLLRVEGLQPCAREERLTGRAVNKVIAVLEVI